MSVPLYMDVQVPAAITHGLRGRAVTVLTAQDDGADRLADPQLLDRTTQLGYVLFTQDQDFLAEAARRQQIGEPFADVVYGPQHPGWIGRYIDDLELLAKVFDPIDMLNRVEYLPL